MKKTAIKQLTAMTLLSSSLILVTSTAHAEGWFDTVTNALGIAETAVDTAKEVTQGTQQTVETVQQVNPDGETQAASGNLVGLVADQLGISQTQAQGGTAAIFQAAQGMMTTGDFQAVSQAVPEMDSLMAAVPQASNSTGLLNSAVASLSGGADSQASQLLGLASNFKMLGLSPQMVTQFVPIISNYIKGFAGEETAALLETVFRGFQPQEG